MPVTTSDELFASLPSGIDICYQTFGDPADPAILLIMGLGGPMGWWPAPFCEQLAEQGFFVIRYDNRDTGRSTKLRQHRVGRSDVVRAFTGLPNGLMTLIDRARNVTLLLRRWIFRAMPLLRVVVTCLRA